MTAAAVPIDDPSLLDAAEVAARLGSDPETGLSAAEAAERLRRDGPNELVAEPPVPVWRRLLAQLADPLVILLGVAVVIATAAWLVEGAHGVPVDSVVIAVIVVLNAVLGYVQEARAERAVAALAELTAAHATVVRDGEVREVPAAELVVGDLLVLGEGDSVAADARLVTATALRVAEASLTGESEPVLKDARSLLEATGIGDRLDMVHRGTAVVQGTGRAVVTATGMTTEMGRIAELLQGTETEPTPLQREIARVGRMLGIAVVAVAVVVVGTVLITSHVHTVEDAVSVLLLGVSLAVAAVPEGLPAVLSVVLAIGVQRMAAQRAIVKRLSSVETLGSASVICTDKTGTLTRSEMTVERVVTASGEVEVTGIGYAPEGVVLAAGSPLTDGPLFDEVAAVLGGAGLATESTLREVDGSWQALGDPTEVALLVAERKLGVHGARERRFRRVGTVPFSSERKLMSAVQADSERDGRLSVVTKGAPDVLLQRCTRIRVGDQEQPLDQAGRSAMTAAVERLSDAALRTLAVAYRPLDAHDVEVDEGVEDDLVLAGVVGIIDPPRPEVRDAIDEAQRAGIRVVMITGDHPGTARRIAADLGVLGPEDAVVTGAELEAVPDAELPATVRRTAVYARVAPAHKLRIVDALQADGQVVAMTGDGVNDAPALRSADIGVAMGVTGTQVSQEASAMILADDNFATIVEAVRQGRVIFDNIRKFLRFLLSSNMGEVLTVFLGVVFAGAIGLTGGDEAVVVPLLATQILWINLLTDTGPALAMGLDPQTDDVMARPPRRLTERVIDARMWGGVLVIGGWMALVTLFAIDLHSPGGLVHGARDIDVARTAGFTVLVLAQLVNAVNARSEETTALHHLWLNRWLWGAIALGVVLQVAVVHLPALNTAFGTAPLTLSEWATCAGLALTVLGVAEARKAVLRAVDRRRAAGLGADQRAVEPARGASGTVA